MSTVGESVGNCYICFYMYERSVDNFLGEVNLAVSSKSLNTFYSFINLFNKNLLSIYVVTVAGLVTGNMA